MAGIFFATLVFLGLVVSGSDAVLSPSELYWKTVLHGAPIPSIIQDLLKSNVERTFSLESRNMSQLKQSLRHLKHYHGLGVPSLVNPDDPNEADFLVEKDLQPGTTMTLHLQRTIDHIGFLPRDVADSIPFSSADLPAILTRFNVKPGSLESKLIEDVLEDCEVAGLPGERKHCATSVESMVDFAASTVGTTRLLAMSPATTARAFMKKQEYTIASPGARRATGPPSSSSRPVTCHPSMYPYAVYFCHLLRNSAVYEVPLLGKDGSRVKAVVICHADTASWNPMHLSLQVLKVKPGTVPICHFIPEDNVIFVPADTSGVLAAAASS